MIKLSIMSGEKFREKSLDINRRLAGRFIHATRAARAIMQESRDRVELLQITDASAATVRGGESIALKSPL